MSNQSPGLFGSCDIILYYVMCLFKMYLFSFFLVVGLLGEIIISVRQHDLIKQEQK